jgi:hypothetical protein
MKGFRLYETCAVAIRAFKTAAIIAKMGIGNQSAGAQNLTLLLLRHPTTTPVLTSG